MFFCSKGIVISHDSAPARHAYIAVSISFINCAPAYGDDDIVNMSNHPIWYIKRAGQLNANIGLALRMFRPKTAINIKFL